MANLTLSDIKTSHQSLKEENASMKRQNMSMQHDAIQCKIADPNVANSAGGLPAAASFADVVHHAEQSTPNDEVNQEVIVARG